MFGLAKNSQNANLKFYSFSLIIYFVPAWKKYKSETVLT